MTGTNWKTARSPRATGSLVSNRMSQLWATLSIQVPTSEIELAGPEQAVVADAHRGEPAAEAHDGAAAMAMRSVHRASPRRPVSSDRS